MDLGVTSLLGLLGFLVLVPFIIIYLIKPKAVKLSIPSLMFFEKASRHKATKTFLKKLLRNLLFLIQLIVLLVLALSLVGPWLSMKEVVSSKNTVIVLDVSASMQAGDRFEIALSETKKLLGRKNTLVLAGSEPVVALEKVSRGELKSFLSSLEVTDAESNIGDSIILAGELLKDTEGRVVVISDFVHTKGMVPLTAKNVLESKGIPVNFVPVSSEGVNLGIVNVKVEESKATLFVKNYHVMDVNTKLRVNEKEYDLDLEAGSIKPLAVEISKGVTEIEILYEDDLVVDNKAFVSIPSEDEIKVLLVTDKGDRYLEAALESAGNVKVDIVESLVLASVDDDYDVYIFSGVDKEKWLVGTLDNVVEWVENGKALILVGQRDMLELQGYQRVLPVKVGTLQSSGNVEVGLATKFTKNVDFGVVKEHFRAENKAGTVSSVAFVENNTVISMGRKKEGNVVYYGLLDSDFHLSPSYPVFWVGLVQYLAGHPGLEDMNLKAGAKHYLPDGKVLSFNKVGVFKYGNVQYGVNLGNERESDINAKRSEGKVLTGYDLERMKEEVVHQFEFWLVLLGLVFVGFEVWFLKWRGALW